MEKPFLSKSPVIHDDRGTFSPTSIRFGHKDDLRLRREWIQTNISINDRAYTFRGLHYQNPLPQAKLIKVIRGQIVDFAVDLSSENFGKCHSWVLNEGDQVFIPKNFAHGFLTIGENTIVQYMVDEDYAPRHEGSIHWSSVPEVNEIVSAIKGPLIISQKDENCRSLEKYKEIYLKPSLDDILLRNANDSDLGWELTIINEDKENLLVSSPNGDTQYMTREEYTSYKNKRNKK